MDNQFYNDSFEQFLKDTVDDFRMYPSKRVWSSLYNNLHPGKKWPSLATTILILGTITLFGSLHKNQVSGVDASNLWSAFSINDNGKQLPAVQPVVAFTSNPNNQPPRNGSSIAAPVTNNFDFSVQPAYTERMVAMNADVQLNTGLMNTEDNFINNESANSINTEVEAVTKQPSNTTISIANAAVADQNTASATINLPTPADAVGNPNSGVGFNDGSLNNNILELVTLNDKEISTANLLSVRKPFVRRRQVNTSDLEWREDYAFHNQRRKKWNGRLARQWYITPSVGYRRIMANTDLSKLALNNSTASLNRSQGNGFVHAPNLNLEFGGAYLLTVSKKLRLKAGFQFNYTKYKVNAQLMDHPAYSPLLLRNESSGEIEIVSRNTRVANIPTDDNREKLNSTTFQLSIPIGADIKLAGNSKIQWFAGASIQPGYLLGGNPYLMSADMRNYILDPSLYRRFNVNTSVETFVSFNFNNHSSLTVGPQFRYQLLSTYDKRYVYNENLYNVGLKIGLIRSF